MYKLEKQKSFIIRVTYYALVLALFYLFLKYVVYAVMPFLVGFAISFMLRPIIRKLTMLTNGWEKLWSIVVILTFYLTVGLAISMLSLKAIQTVTSFIQTLPSLYETYISPLFNDSIKWLNSFIEDFTVFDFDDVLHQVSGSLTTIVSSVSSGLMNLLTGVTVSLPSLVLSFFFSIISSFFICIDYRKITRFVMLQLNDREKEILKTVRHFIKGTVWGFLIGYAKIMCITFIELCIGFSTLHIGNGVTIAFIIAVFDILPVLGTGGIMLPWVVFCFLSNQIGVGIGLLIVYIIITVIRNILEPKIVGKQIGLHPLLMLISMYFGISLFGFLGLFILPFLILVMKELNEKGLIHLYKV